MIMKNMKQKVFYEQIRLMRISIEMSYSVIKECLNNGHFELTAVLKCRILQNWHKNEYFS